MLIYLRCKCNESLSDTQGPNGALIGKFGSKHTLLPLLLILVLVKFMVSYGHLPHGKRGTKIPSYFLLY